MTCQLLADCLDEIFEYLKEDRLTLHSCLLVSRLWCRISVRILWRNICNIKSKERPLILSTLIACLPNESKELLRKKKIFISPPTSKPPLFNYAIFCKALSIYEIDLIVYDSIRNKLAKGSLLSDYINSISLITNEIIKMFTFQVSSLKKLDYYYNYYFPPTNFPLNYFPGLKNLLELGCISTLPSNFFYQLSQVCHGLRSISININNNNISKELKKLISSQNNLQNIILSAFDDKSWADIIPSLTKHSDSITKLYLYSNNDNLSLSFISLFSNLQEIILSLPNCTKNYENLGEPGHFKRDFADFKELQYTTFSKLQTLKIPYHCPKVEQVIKFLKNNGKNLKKLYISKSNKDLSLSISKSCPNIKSLYIIFKNGELNILKMIFISCRYLESIKILCGTKHLNKKEVLETVAKYSPNNFCELKLYSSSYSRILSEDLESFFKTWKNRTPKKLLTLTMIKGDYFNRLEVENMKIVEKYENLGIIKFEVKPYYQDEKEENLYYL